jgi:predicted acylesterase/phospholipase RssA
MLRKAIREGGSRMPTFKEILEAEKRNLARIKPDDPETGETFGLAFSGGGIRSATFNLGVLQGLAQAGLLAKAKYLSTVSGGGYIGGWLCSWIKRAPGGMSEVQDKLGNYERHRDVAGDVAEPKQINFLRDYSNYLTLRK